MRKSRRAFPAYERRSRRYRWAKDHGCTSQDALRLADRIPEFRAFASSLGIDPDSLGDFARDMGHGGKPRRDTPEAIERRRVYRELRDLGASPRDAMSGANSTLARARIRRELRGSMFRTERQ